MTRYFHESSSEFTSRWRKAVEIPSGLPDQFLFQEVSRFVKVSLFQDLLAAQSDAGCASKTKLIATWQILSRTSRIIF